MDKKTILAIVLSTLVIIVWMKFYLPTVEEQKKKIPPAVQKQEQVLEKEASTGTGTTAPVVVAPGASQKEESTIDVNTGTYRFQFTNRGAAIKHLVFNERNIDLVIENSKFQARGWYDFALHFGQDEFLNGNALDNTLWTGRQVDGNTVVYTTSLLMDGNPLTVEKKYVLKQNAPDFTVTYRLVNTGKNKVVLKENRVIISPSELVGPKLDFSNTYNNISGSIYSLKGKFKKEQKGGGGIGLALGCDSARPAGDVKTDVGSIDWFGIMGRYFLVIMIPDKPANTGIVMDNRTQTGYRTGVLIPVNGIDAGKEYNTSFRVYLGEKDKKQLAAIDKRIVPAADISTLIEPIRYFVLWSLTWINKFVGNLGWALVIFSLLTKIIFTPLTMKSNESMKKMQQLSPQLKKLQEKYKDKPDVMQREMMKMYKENKVNPLGGCLPLLLQMPFFFALYSALINSITLWNAPFGLWIKDLSMPDTVAQLMGYNINILPLLMTASTFAVQKMTTVETSQQQKMMMYIMPLVFIFIFWNMPSGLVLYWTLQNVFQIAHQLIITRFSKNKGATA